MSKRCLNCDSELPDHAKFCNKCGTPAPEQKSELFCSKCGTKLEAGTKFCSRCGAPVEGTSDTNSAGTGTNTQDQAGHPQPITDFSKVSPKKQHLSKLLGGLVS